MTRHLRGGKKLVQEGAGGARGEERRGPGIRQKRVGAGEWVGSDGTGFKTWLREQQGGLEKRNRSCKVPKIPGRRGLPTSPRERKKAHRRQIRMGHPMRGSWTGKEGREGGGQSFWHHIKMRAACGGDLLTCVTEEILGCAYQRQERDSKRLAEGLYRRKTENIIRISDITGNPDA